VLALGPLKNTGVARARARTTHNGPFTASIVCEKLRRADKRQFLPAIDAEKPRRNLYARYALGNFSFLHFPTVSLNPSLSDIKYGSSLIQTREEQRKRRSQGASLATFCEIEFENIRNIREIKNPKKWKTGHPIERPLKRCRKDWMSTSREHRHTG
jgi:hypothetical protein